MGFNLGLKNKELLNFALKAFPGGADNYADFQL